LGIAIIILAKKNPFSSSDKKKEWEFDLLFKFNPKPKSWVNILMLNPKLIF
jgi:hypothetical protein